MNKIWTDMPPSAYSVSVGGLQVGIGLLPVWEAVPGAWNILSLMAGPDLEALLTWDKDPMDFPLAIGHAPYAVAMAMQWVSAGLTWGELAVATTPSQFLRALQEHPEGDKTLLPLLFRNEFWRRAKAKAATYHNYPANVVRVNFGGVH